MSLQVWVSHEAMRTNDIAERISVQREEGTQDGALRDPSSERARFRHGQLCRPLPQPVVIEMVVYWEPVGSHQELIYPLITEDEGVQ